MTRRGTVDASLGESFTAELLALLPRLRAFARSILRDASAAEDLVQEAVLRAWAARERYTPGTNMRAWLYLILRRVHLSQLRRRRFDVELDETVERRLSVPETQSAILFLREVGEAIEQLGEDQRLALEFIAMEGQSYEEAASTLGVPVGTIKSRVTRARDALAAKFSANADPGEPQGQSGREMAGNDPIDGQSHVAAKARWRAAKLAGRGLLIG